MFVDPSELNDEVQSYNYKTVSLLRLEASLIHFHPCIYIFFSLPAQQLTPICLSN